MSENTKRTITAEDLYQFEQITSQHLSPDGKQVIFAVQRVERKTEKKYTNLWLASVESGESQPFTHGNQSDGSPHWSPDGRQIAFISNRGDEKQPQIYLIPAHGGEARPLTHLQGEFGGFEWSPDGRHLVCQFRKMDAEAAEREKDEQKKKLGIVSRRFKRVYFKLDGYGYLPQERWHIWVIDALTGEARQITDSEIHDDAEPHWSPDGRRISFFSNRTPDPDLDMDVIDLWLIDADGGNLQKLPTPVGPKEMASFSPDGRWLAYTGREGRGNEWHNTRLWVVATDGSQQARCLTAAYDEMVAGWTINDIGGASFRTPTWAKDGSKLYFQVARHGSTTLNVVSMDGSGYQALFGEGGVVNAFDFDPQQKYVVYNWGSLSDPCQIMVRDLASGAHPRQITRLNAWLKEVDLGEIEEVWFKGADQNDLQGWILKPPAFDASQKYPSVLEIHGGPLVQYGFFFMHEFYYLASQGYVVYFCNPRGGQGYGEQHAGAIHGAWGTADYADLMKWTDLLVGKPYIDSQRMAVTGGSYGGYMTNWIIGHTHRFQAAATQRSVSNLISMWGSSDFNYSFQETFGNKAPYENIDQLWECSPMKHIGSARTPTLVLHNEQDMRCDMEQGEQVFVALKTMGVDTEMVVFPEEPHGLSRTGRTDRRIVRLQSISGWFDRYLKPKA